jgi:hypothetical protein
MVPALFMKTGAACAAATLNFIVLDDAMTEFGRLRQVVLIQMPPAKEKQGETGNWSTRRITSVRETF